MTTHFEPLDHLLEIRSRIVVPKNHLNRLPDQIARDAVGSLQLSFILQFDFSGNRWERGIDIPNSGDYLILASQNRTTLRIADHVFETRNWQALAHAGSFVNSLVPTGLESYSFNNLLYELGDQDPNRIALNPCFLLGYGNAVIEVHGIVGFDLGSDSIFERSNDLAAGSVILWICREHNNDIERQPHRIALNLNVALLHDIEQADLNLAGEIRQLVNSENSSIRSGKQTVVHTEFAANRMTALRGLNWVDVADDIGNRDVRRRKLFDISLVPTAILNKCAITEFGNEIAATSTDRLEGIVIDFATGNDGNDFIQQRNQIAQDPAFGLSPQPEKDHVVPRKNRVDRLWNDRFFVSD